MFSYLWIALALLVGWVAHRKGRGPVVWFLLSWAITPVLALALVLWQKPSAEGLAWQRFRRDERRCPACGAFSARATLTCPACQAGLPPVPKTAASPCRVPSRPRACLICGDTAIRETDNPAYSHCATCGQRYELPPLPGTPEEAP